MSCKICSITSGKLRQAVEDALVQFDGTLPQNTKAKLCESYPEFAEVLDGITTHDCEIHFNFHQVIGRCAQPCSIPETEEAERPASIAKDVGKDEAEVLLDLLNTQYATFTALTNKINGAITRAKADEMIGLLINPGTTQFYKELGDSVRATVRELRELNTAINGKQDALEGLKALAAAFGAGQETSSAVADERATTMFDD